MSHHVCHFSGASVFNTLFARNLWASKGPSKPGSPCMRAIAKDRPLSQHRMGHPARVWQKRRTRRGQTKLSGNRNMQYANCPTGAESRLFGLAAEVGTDCADSRPDSGWKNASGKPPSCRASFGRPAGFAPQATPCVLAACKSPQNATLATTSVRRNCKGRGALQKLRPPLPGRQTAGREGVLGRERSGMSRQWLAPSRRRHTFSKTLREPPLQQSRREQTRGRPHCLLVYSPKRPASRWSSALCGVGAPLI